MGTTRFGVKLKIPEEAEARMDALEVACSIITEGAIWYTAEGPVKQGSLAAANVGYK